MKAKNERAMTHHRSTLLIEKERDGFDVKCASCGGHNVAIEAEMFHSPQDGMFGAAFLKCQDCNLTTVIWRVDYAPMQKAPLGNV